MPEASATAPLAAWSSNDPRLTRAPRVLRAAQERGTTSAATRDDGAQGALPTGTSDATRCTRRRAVLASLGCARTRLLTPSALREQHASAAKKLCPSKVRRIVLNPRQRFSCLTRAAKASCARCGCDFHQTAARGAQARVCSSKRQRNLAEVTRPVPGATIPAALSMDCSAAPACVLFLVLAEASQNGSFAGTSSNSVEVCVVGEACGSGVRRSRRGDARGRLQVMESHGVGAEHLYDGACARAARVGTRGNWPSPLRVQYKL
jgi:hypothetical protein